MAMAWQWKLKKESMKKPGEVGEMMAWWRTWMADGQWKAEIKAAESWNHERRKYWIMNEPAKNNEWNEKVKMKSNENNENNGKMEWK